MRVPFILALPWGLFGRTDIGGRPVRAPIHDGETVHVDASHGLAFAVPAGCVIRSAGRKAQPYTDSKAFPWPGGDFQMRALPSGTRISENSVDFVLEDNGRRIEFRLDVDGYLPRPRNLPADLPAAIAMHQFLLELLARINEAAPTAEETWPAFRSGWDRIQSRWLDKDAMVQEPPLAIIVDHAATMPNLLRDLAEHPRRVLSRSRQLMPVGRIRELDHACIDWFVRQPGMTVAEKAGGRQLLKGLARQQDFDTLENQILRDLLRISMEEAGAYVRTNANRRYFGSERLRSVSGYRGTCRGLLDEIEVFEIRPPTHPISPNHVLLHDPRYRKIWSAYLDLLADRDRRDDIWRWQRRLWAEFVRLTLVAAFQSALGARPVTRTPLGVAKGQADGRWTDTSGELACLIVTHQARQVIVTVVDAAEPRGHPAYAPWHASLGCAAIVHLADPETGRSGVICVWAVHGAAESPIALEDLVQSADEALRRAIEAEGLRGGTIPNARGLVIRSSPDHRVIGPELSGDVHGYAFGATAASLLHALLAAGELILDSAIGAML